MVSEEDVRKLIMNSSSATCELDPIPTKLLKEYIDIMVAPITRIVNLSLSSGFMSNDLKKAIITPIIKKLQLDLDILKNFRPISNLCFISKIIEKYKV